MEEQGYVDREVWRKAGENGFLCMTMTPEEYGGQPGADKLYFWWRQMDFEIARRWGERHRLWPAQRDRGAVHPALRHRGAQKHKYLPLLLATGEMVGAIAMSEPAAGSDLQGVKTTAIKQADGSTCSTGKTFSPTAGTPTW